MESQELENLMRVARESSKAAGGTGGRRDPLVGLSVDLLMVARQSGLSPTESGCLFLLIASHLLDDVPAQALAGMIEEVRQRTPWVRGSAPKHAPSSPLAKAR